MKRSACYDIAEAMFVEKRLSLDLISKDINVSTRTLGDWKREGDWEQKRLQFIKNQNACNRELYGLLKDLSEMARVTIKSNKVPEPHLLNTINNLSSAIVRLKTYEDMVVKEETEVKKEPASVDDKVNRIREVFGI